MEDARIGAMQESSPADGDYSALLRSRLVTAPPARWVLTLPGCGGHRRRVLQEGPGGHRALPRAPRAPAAARDPGTPPGPLLPAPGTQRGCGGHAGPEPRPSQRPAGLRQPKG